MNKMLSHYERLAEAYHDKRDCFDLSDLFEAFYAHLAPLESGLVLDLGCGAGDGFPTYFLQRGWRVEGVDFSEKMLALCHQQHPEMATTCADLSDWSHPEQRYDVIESIYALFHLSNEAQLRLLQGCYDALKSGGMIYFTYATKEYTGGARYEGLVDFMGSPLFYAHLEPETLQSELLAMGFVDIQLDQQEIGGESFLWVLARKV